MSKNLVDKLVELYKRQLSISESELKKLEVRYEGMVAREKRYLKQIEQLKAQNESLYHTYSYRLGFLIIHSTKSFKNFVSLPVEFRKLYKENKKRKIEKAKKKPN